MAQVEHARRRFDNVIELRSDALHISDAAYRQASYTAMAYAMQQLCQAQSFLAEMRGDRSDRAAVIVDHMIEDGQAAVDELTRPY